MSRLARTSPICGAQARHGHGVSQSPTRLFPHSHGGRERGPSVLRMREVPRARDRAPAVRPAGWPHVALTGRRNQPVQALGRPSSAGGRSPRAAVVEPPVLLCERNPLGATRPQNCASRCKFELK